MIAFDRIRDTIVTKIKESLNIEVVRVNQNAPPPAYPYIGYTITTLMKTNNGTYSEYVENNVKVYCKEFQQIWSFTVFADNDLQSKEIAIRLYDYLDNIGAVDLSENDIVIQRIGNITNRDTLLTIDYEYRNGFDVTFAFMNEIKNTNAESEVIDNYTITPNIID